MNKEFIRGLFPEGTIYASLLPQQAQDVIGKVGAQTRGVEKLLRRIGFRYAERVDPFDGGPHFTAMIDEISLVKDTERREIESLLPSGSKTKKRGLVAIEPGAAPWFRAVLASFDEQPNGTCALEESAATSLGLKPGDSAWILALD